MKFKVAGSARAGDYIAAGKHGAAAARNAFIAARKSAPDYGGLGQTDMNARSEERQVVTKVGGQVAEAGLRAMETTKRSQIKADTIEKNAKRKASGQRMAGIVGGLGAVAGGAFMGIEKKRDDAAQAKRDADESARWDQRMQQIENYNNRPTYQAPEREPLPTYDEWTASQDG